MKIAPFETLGLANNANKRKQQTIFRMSWRLLGTQNLRRWFLFLCSPFHGQQGSQQWSVKIAKKHLAFVTLMVQSWLFFPYKWGVIIFSCVKQHMTWPPKKYHRPITQPKFLPGALVSKGSEKKRANRSKVSSKASTFTWNLEVCAEKSAFAAAWRSIDIYIYIYIDIDRDKYIYIYIKPHTCFMKKHYIYIYI